MSKCVSVKTGVHCGRGTKPHGPPWRIEQATRGDQGGGAHEKKRSTRKLGTKTHAEEVNRGGNAGTSRGFKKKKGHVLSTSHKKIEKTLPLGRNQAESLKAAVRKQKRGSP